MNRRKRSRFHLLSPFVTHSCLVAALYLTVCPLAWGQATQKASATPPKEVVAMLLGGLEQNDFRKVFEVTYAYQADVQEIRGRNPQVMWQRLTDEYYEAKKSVFVEPATSTRVRSEPVTAFREDRHPSPEDPAEAPFRPLLRAHPVWKVLEARQLERVWDGRTGGYRQFSVVYVQLNYASAEAAPLLIAEGLKPAGILERDVLEGVLKEVILAIRIESESGLFWSAQVVPASVVYWSDSPLRILSIQVSTGGVLNFNLVGGRSPYQTKTRCGEIDFEARGRILVGKPGRVSILGPAGPFMQSHIEIIGVHLLNAPELLPLACTASVTDSRNAQDTVGFSVRRPARIDGPFCWIREPWYGWGQGRPHRGCIEVMELTGATSGALAKPPETPPPPGSAGQDPVPTSSSAFHPPTGNPNATVSLGWLGVNNDFPSNPFHLGVDFPTVYGAQVYSIADGKIALVRTDVGKYGGLDRPGGGMFVEYRTETGQTFYALYAHVESMKGSGCVKAGEQIATVGHYYNTTGKDGPHLHFAVFFGDQLPSGDNWPWRQYVSSPSDNPGWQDPLFVLSNMKPGTMAACGAG